MSKRLGVFELDNPSFPAESLSDHDYDNYEGFDAYPMLSMPIHLHDHESVAGSRKKEIIYL